MEEGREEELCDMCEKRPKKKKQKRCGICLADLQAARRDANNQGRSALFQSLMKQGGKELQDFLHAFVRANPDRRPYQQRSSFDWVRYEEATELQRKLRVGFKCLMKDKDQFLNFYQSEKGLPRPEALARWEVEVKQARHFDYDGRGGSIRIPVRVQDFIVGEEIFGQRTSVTKGYKQQKHGEQTEQAMIQGAAESFASGSFKDFMKGENLQELGMGISFNAPEICSGGLLDNGVLSGAAPSSGSQSGQRAEKALEDEAPVTRPGLAEKVYVCMYSICLCETSGWLQLSLCGALDVILAQF